MAMFRVAITSAEDLHPIIEAMPSLSAAERIVVGHGPRTPDGKPYMPTGQTREAVAYANVNFGRWSVHCPWCMSSQNASREDHRFWCVGCCNAPVDGQWVTVVWPDDWKAIEDALGRRIDPATRTWVPGETAADAYGENAARGVK